MLWFRNYYLSHKPGPMKKTSLLFLALLVIPLQYSFAQTKIPDIIPIPQHWTWMKGKTDLSAINQIVLAANSDAADHFTAEQIQETFNKILDQSIAIKTGITAGVTNAIIIGNPKTSGFIGKIVSPDSFDSLMQREGYVFKMDGKNVIIAGLSATGRFYGAMTMDQLIESAGSSHEINNISIKDYPSMKFRGISDDMSRGQVSTEKNLEKIIRFLAGYKMNTYMPYIEDLFHFKQFPDIGKNRGAFTRQELETLQNYAAKYHVQIIPAFETLGHQENILLNPKYVKYSEYPGSASFSTQDPGAYDFVDTLISDMLPVFHSKYFSMGGDESFDVGLGASKQAVERYGLATINARYYQKIYKFLHQHHKTVIMYGDMLLRDPLALSQIPKDLIVMDWHYGSDDNFSSTETFANAHQPFIVSPGINDWSAIYPRQSAAWVNIYNLTLQGYKNGAIGSINSSWGDFGGPNFRELNYRGYAYGAECSWNPLMADETTIDIRFNKIFFSSGDARLLAIQSQLNDMSEDFSFPDIWRQPFDRLQLFEKHGHLPVLTEATDIFRNGSYILGLIHDLRDHVHQNSNILDYYAFDAKLGRWFGNSLLFARWMHTKVDQNITAESRKHYVSKAVTWATYLENRIGQLQKDYNQLWLRTNKPDNLSRIDTLFRYQKEFLKNIVDGLKNNSWDTSYEIPSNFIAVHGASKDNPVTAAYLRKSFRIDPNKHIKHAWLQVIGDTNFKVWVNGHEVEHNYARRQLSLLVDLRRSTFHDVARLLNSQFQNDIAVEVHSYNPPAGSHSFMDTRPAAANIYLDIEYTDGTSQKILSDAYWKSHTFPEKGWTQPNFDDSYWLPAGVVNDFPFNVYQPMFDKGLPSFITF